MTRFLASPMALALGAIITALVVATSAQAQTTCTKSKCTVALAKVGSPVVDGCGEHATPGRMKVIFSSTDSSVTRASFPVAGYFIQAGSDHRSSAFSDWEWRSPILNNGRWQDAAIAANRIGWAGGVLGENIIEVRPKAGARIWSEGGREGVLGGMVVQDFDLPSGSTTTYAAPGEPYFLFMGGKGCARVGPGGGLLGGNQ